jgi:hypothetical protein
MYSFLVHWIAALCCLADENSVAKKTGICECADQPHGTLVFWD